MRTTQTDQIETVFFSCNFISTPYAVAAAGNHMNIYYVVTTLHTHSETRGMFKNVVYNARFSIQESQLVIEAIFYFCCNRVDDEIVWYLFSFGKCRKHLKCIHQFGRCANFFNNWENANKLRKKMMKNTN